MASIPFSPFTQRIKSLPNASKQNRPLPSLSPNTTANSNSLSIIAKPKSRFFTKVSKRTYGGPLSVFACSTSSSFIGKVGFQRREGNFSSMSFGANPSRENGVAAKTDSSQTLSALLPFVVALTAVAALTQPSTFTW